MSSSKEKPLFLKPGGKVVRFKKSHLNDPHVVEHARRVQAMVEKYGLPKELLDKDKPR